MRQQTTQQPNTPPPCGLPAIATRFIPVTLWPEYHPWPSVAGLRWLAFNASRNGFAPVICRAAGRVLIDEQAFFAWVAQEGRTK